MIEVLLVDDQELVRNGLIRILNSHPELKVIGECTDGDEVVQSVTQHKPDVVLMDVRMSRMDGISATKALRLMGNAPPVMMLTTFSDDDVLWSALDAGASGFVLKDATAEDILRATQVIAAGGAWLDSAVTNKVIEQYRRQRPAANHNTELDCLTAREHEVLVLIAEGLLNSEIAEKLFVSDATIKSHISHIFRKLDLRDRAAAIVLAYDKGIVRPRT